MMLALNLPRRATRRRGTAAGQSLPDRLPGDGSPHPPTCGRRSWTGCGSVVSRRAEPRLRAPVLEGHAERFAAFATEMIQLQVDCIIAITTPAALAVKHATQTIPIVMTTAIDPVGAGLVTSLARPGGTVTGNAILYGELSTKRLELLKDVVPGLSRVAVLWNPANPANTSVWHGTQAAARALGLQLHAQDVQGAGLRGRVRRTVQAHPEALPRPGRCVHQHAPRRDRGVRHPGAPASCRGQGIGRGWRSDVLWSEPAGPVPPRRPPTWTRSCKGIKPMTCPWSSQ